MRCCPAKWLWPGEADHGKLGMDVEVDAALFKEETAASWGFGSRGAPRRERSTARAVPRCSADVGVWRGRGLLSRRGEPWWLTRRAEDTVCGPCTSVFTRAPAWWRHGVTVHDVAARRGSRDGCGSACDGEVLGNREGDRGTVVVVCSSVVVAWSLARRGSVATPRRGGRAGHREAQHGSFMAWHGCYGKLLDRKKEGTTWTWLAAVKKRSDGGGREMDEGDGCCVSYSDTGLGLGKLRQSSTSVSAAGHAA